MSETVKKFTGGEVVELNTTSDSKPSPSKKIKQKVITKKKEFGASFYPGLQKPLPAKFVETVQEIEKHINKPVWLLIHRSDSLFNQIDEQLKKMFFNSRAKLTPKKPIALIIDSPGGQAKSAYQLARLFNKHCGGFTAIVPRYAKSAATLLTLGANSIILNEFAELGPLDAQLFDPDREEIGSALDQVQTLERLNAFALETIDQTVMMLINRTGKKVESLLPITMRYVSDVMRPLLEKVDVIHYTQVARILKVAEEYAVRLLQPRYTKEHAERIARHLVEKYPEHGFVIDADEASNPELGLEIERPDAHLASLMDKLVHILPDTRFSIIGRLEEISHDNKE